MRGQPPETGRVILVALPVPRRDSIMPPRAGRGRLDGGWRPRSRDARVELPALVSATAARAALAARVGHTGAQEILESCGIATEPIRVPIPRRNVPALGDSRSLERWLDDGGHSRTTI